MWFSRCKNAHIHIDYPPVAEQRCPLFSVISSHSEAATRRIDLGWPDNILGQLLSKMKVFPLFLILGLRESVECSLSPRLRLLLGVFPLK
jgi:hypothetical protein